MSTIRDLEDRDIISAHGERAIRFFTRGTERAQIRVDSPVIDMARTSVVPDAPSARRGGYFFQDDGAGKMQFCVRFPSGVVQILATEP